MNEQDLTVIREKLKAEKNSLTPMQIARRKYEEKNKAERDLRVQFGTTISRESYDEINAFLEKYKISKVDLIYAGYYTLKEQREAQNKK